MATNKRLSPGLIRGDDGKARCFWAGSDPEYVRYHDEEWGRPTYDDRQLFEKICLEGFQSGLSWLTILKKRDNFRRAFADFDFERVARFREKKIVILLGDAGIVRHRGKIESTINNAACARRIVEEFGSFSDYVWQFVPPKAERPRKMNHRALLQNTKPQSAVLLSKDLKKRGFSFVGPTTCYAFMQAMGLVNDHIDGCAFRDGCGPPTTT